MSRPLHDCFGRCHCSAVRVEIRTDFPELTTCDCSIRRRRSALMVRVHKSALRLLAPARALAEYRFHTGMARHYVCRTCDKYPFHRKRLYPDHYAVNVHGLEGIELDGIPVRATVGAAMD